MIIKSLFSFDSCFGGSLTEENLEPIPPAKITTDIRLLFIFIKINELTHIYNQVKYHFFY